MNPPAQTEPKGQAGVKVEGPWYARWLRRALLWLFAMGLLLTLSGGTAFLVGWYRYNGEALARYLSHNWSRKHRGRLVIGRIDWTPKAVWDLLTGDYHKFEITHVAIYDSRGRLAVYVPKVTGWGKIWPLIVHGDFIIKDAYAEEALLVIDRYRRPDGPSLTGKQWEVGLVGAFERAGIRKRRGPRRKKHRSVVSVDHLKIDRMRFELRFPKWMLALDDAELEGSITGLGKQGAKPGRVFFDATTRAPKGLFTLGNRRVRIRNLQVVRARTDPRLPDGLDFNMRAEVEGARVEAQATTCGLYRVGGKVDGSALVRNAGEMLAKLTNGIVGGTNAKLDLVIGGPLRNPTVEVRVANLQAKKGKYEVGDAAADVRMEDRKVHLRSATASLLNGRATATGMLDLRSLEWNARLAMDRLDSSALIAGRRTRRKWAGILSGVISATGEVRKRNADVTIVREIRYKRHRAPDNLPRTIAARGKVFVTPRDIGLKRLTLAGGDLTVSATGGVDLKTRRLRMEVEAAANRARRLLRRMRIPPVAQSFRLAGAVRGRMTNPRFNGALAVRGVGHRPGSSGWLQSEVHLSNGTLQLQKVRANLYGGGMAGSATMRLYQADVRRVYRNPILTASMRMYGLRLNRMTGRKKLRGQVHGGLKLTGTVRAPRGQVWLQVPRLTVGKHQYNDGRVELTLKRGDVMLDYAGMRRQGGGRMRAWGVLRKGGAVELTAQAEALPLAGIPGLDRLAPKALSGLLSANVAVTGSRNWPLLNGSLKLVRAKVRGIMMGDANIRVDPGADANVVSGDLFRHFKVKGFVTLKPNPALNLSITFDRFPLEKLVPEMSRVADAKGHVTGSMELTLNRRGLTWAQLNLTDVQVEMTSPNPDPTGPAEKIQIHNEGPMRIAYNGRRVTLENFRLAGAAGNFAVKGWLEPGDSNLTVDGKVGLKPLEFFAREQLDDLRGHVLAHLTFRGPPKAPLIAGHLKVQNATAVLAGRSEPIHFPSGLVRVANVRRSLKRLKLVLKDLKVSVAKETLVANGTLNTFKGRASDFSLHVSGIVSAKALEVAAPKLVSHASGRTRVNVRISGTPVEYNIWGVATLERTDVRLRGLRRDVVIHSGQLTFDGSRLTLDGVRATVDEGLVTAKGYAVFKRRRISDLDVKVSCQNIPYKKSRVVDAEISANLNLTGDEQGLTLGGQVDIVDGRYIQQFDVVKRAFLKKRVYESAPPAWERYPLLANMTLNLNVSTAGNFFIQNNLADMRLDGNIYVGGLMTEPRLGGQIQVEEGRFRIPFMRGKYQVRSGEVDFNRGKEPYLLLVGETTVTDKADTEHLITLTLEGFLSEIKIDFKSDTNLEKSQILMLLATGRTTDSLRRDVQGTRDPGAGTGGSANPVDIYDPVLKQVSGDFLSDLVAKPIKDITRLDLFRLELGTESFQVRVEKRLGKYFTLVGETEFGLLGRQRQEGRLEGKFHDNVYMDVKGRRLIPGEDVFEAEDPLQGRIQLRYRLQFKGGLIRSLGF